MTRLRLCLVVTIVLGVFAVPGLGCSHEGSSAVFTQVHGPDRPYSAYVRGRLGVIGRQYAIRNMVVAYDILSGRGLTPIEQKGAEETDRYYNPAGYRTASNASPPGGTDEEHPAPGKTRWDTMVQDAAGSGTERLLPGQTFETFTNCLDDAFAHAADTLIELRTRYGKAGSPDSPELKDWVAGQQAVFANCGSEVQPGSPSTLSQRPADPVATLPNAAPASAPLWLRQQRAYQIAAAHMYALDFDAALRDFRAVAGDGASPLAPLARYVVARVYLRRAELTPRPMPANATPEDARKATQANTAAALSDYAAARDQLQGILRDPAMRTMQGPSRHLLDFVMLRLDPAAQAEELARRLTAAPRTDGDFKQAVIDLGYAYTSLPQVAWPRVLESRDTPLQAGNPLLRWMNDMYGPGNGPSGSTGLKETYERSRTEPQVRQDALGNWRTTHSLQWLVAALTLAQPGEAANPELILAAKAVPAGSPAYPSVTYHRLRLGDPASAQGKAFFEEVTALLPEIERTQSRSTANLFQDLQAGSAPTLEAFLKSSMRLPASYTDVDGNEDGMPGPDWPINSSVTLCGAEVYSPKTMHFDAEVATILNQRLPLHSLRDAALAETLPANLRFQLAHMAWTRALLLDDSETALALGPLLGQCQPAFKPWLAQYAAANTPGERHLFGLLAMMRFTSTEPMVRVGGERDFASYDAFRDNWWCAANTPAVPSPSDPGGALFFQQLLVSESAQPDPPFLSQADRIEAGKEIAALGKIPGASDYFAREALSWVKAHPDAQQNADLLGFAMRVVRNACRSDATGELNHQLFDTLHARYPGSEWAKRYTTWE